MKKLVAVITTLITLSSSTFAGSFDVVPKSFKHGSPYVRVTKLKSDKVKFEKCVKGYEASSCQQLGPKSSYSKEDLESQRRVENWQIAGTVAADIAIIVALVYGGEAAGSALGGAGSAGASSYFAQLAGSFIGVGAGAGAGITAIALLDPVNPIEQTKQAKTLNSDILNDELVVRSDIEAYIDRLELVLNKID